MTQDEKELLLKDLSARLPYGVKVTDGLHIIELKVRIDTAPATLAQFINSNKLKYYLRPMSSMTEEEINYLAKLLDYKVPEDIKIEGFYTFMVVGKFIDSKLEHLINFLNERHFDYRGLIGKGLVLEAPEEIYKTE